MSKIFVDQVDPKTATTLTLGTSGDTISIPSGVTIANSGTATGFGDAFSVTDITGQTALDEVPATTDEAVISDGGVLKRVDFNYIMNEPCFLSYKTANSTFADATFTTLVNATMVQNSGTCYDTSNGRFTCPAGQGGSYYMYGSFRINNYDPNICRARFKVNGSSLGHSEQETVPDGSVSGRHPSMMISMIMNLSATDYVEFQGYQGSGSSDTIFQSVFGGFKIR